MHNVDAIVIVEFRRKSDAAYSRVWKWLDGITLEQRFSLPLVLLAAGNQLELRLDEALREFRIEHLRWEHQRQTLHVHLLLTEQEANSLRDLGIKAWRPWVRRRVIDDFLERCRQTGWLQRGGKPSRGPSPSAPSNTQKRVEPTL